MKTDNRTQGNRFEQELSSRLAERGFWVHVMQQNSAGQPADIIAVKGKFHTLIDCKLISDDRGFTFDRIEENQKYAMKLFHRRCGEMCYFALKLQDGNVRMVSLEKLEQVRLRGRKRFSDKEIQTQAWPLEDWLDASDAWAEDI